MADDAGALLVRSGLVSATALDDARARIAEAGGTLLEQLVSGGAVPDDQLTSFFKSRLLVPQVNPNTLARLSAKVVALIPGDMAIELRVIPVSIDGENNLTVAMSDPSDRHAVDEIAFFTGAYVVRAVATQMQIAWCLAHYYGHITHLGQRLLQGSGAVTTAASQAAAQAAVRPRAKGLTGKVDAARHRAIAPGAGADALAAPRPRGEALDAAQAAQAAEAGAVVEQQPQARSVSGEIRVPHVRAQSIKPLVEEPFEEHGDRDDDGSGPVISVIADEPSAPVITIEADGEPSAPMITIEAGGEEATPPRPTTRPAPKRKRPAEPDPPELAARAGEIGSKTGPVAQKLDTEEPRVVIEDGLDWDGLPERISRQHTAPVEPGTEASGEVSIDVLTTAPELTVVPGPVDDQGPSIQIEIVDTASAPVVIHESPRVDSAPILLVAPKPARPPTPRPVAAAAAAVPTEVHDEPSDVVMLEARKPQRPERITQVGMEPPPPPPPSRVRAAGDSVPPEVEDEITGSRSIDPDPTRLDAHAVPAGDYTTSDEILAAPPSPARDDDTSPHIAPPSAFTAIPPPSGQVRLDGVRPAANQLAPNGDDEDDDEDTDDGESDRPHRPVRATAVMSTQELDERIPGRTSEVIPAHLSAKPRVPPPNTGDQTNAIETVDDGWGPPGSTIPPPLLGAIPGSIAPTASGVIPIADVDSAPLMLAPPSPPEQGRAQTSAPIAMVSSGDASLVRALEEATTRVLELIRALEHAMERDEVIAVMMQHLVETHRRAGFFAARAGELQLFALSPRPVVMPYATLRLEHASTLQDVVGTRLPYRGPITDEASQAFLVAALGACPPEILLVPVTVRERAVGVLFGEHRLRHTFDDQLALAARAAGAALERILKAKRG